MVLHQVLRRHVQIIIDIGLRLMMEMIKSGTILQIGHALKWMVQEELQLQTQNKTALFTSNSSVDVKLNQNVENDL